MNYIKYDITAEMVDRAIERTTKVGLLKGNQKGVSAVTDGNLGEQVFKKYLDDNGIPNEPDIDNFHHDFFVCGKTIEVKSKLRTVQPRPDFSATVPAAQINHQRPDWFIFISLEKDRKARVPHTAYIVGRIRGHEFVKRSIFKKKGTLEPNGMVIHHDCYNVFINQLEELK